MVRLLWLLSACVAMATAKLISHWDDTELTPLDSNNVRVAEGLEPVHEAFIAKIAEHSLHDSVEHILGHSASSVYYFPHDHFLFTASMADALRLSSSAHVEMVSKMPASLKISPLFHSTLTQRLHAVNATDDLVLAVTTAHHSLESALAFWRESLPEAAIAQVSPLKVHISFKRGSRGSSDHRLARQISSTAEWLANQRESVWIEVQSSLKLLNRYSGDIVQGGSYDATNPKGRTIHAQGLLGDGEIVGIGDSGLDVNSCFFYDSQVAPPFDAISNQHRKLVTYDTRYGDRSDVIGHGSHCSGSIAGNAPVEIASPYNGMAPNAKIAFVDIAAGGWFQIPPTLEEYHSIVYEAGARVQSNSWGVDANVYDSLAAETDNFSYQHDDFVALWAAGNDGSCGAGTIGSPATSKNGITVGAGQNAAPGFIDGCLLKHKDNCTAQFPADVYTPENLAAFTSRGPGSAFRFKPEVIAPGESIISAKAQPDVSIPVNTCPTLESAVQDMSGTSMATPITAGSLSLIRQYYRKGYYPSGQPLAGDSIQPSAALLKATLINGAVPMLGIDDADKKSLQQPTPNYLEGYGRIKLDSVLRFGADSMLNLFVDQDSAVNSRQSRDYCFEVQSQLKATLVWTDPPALPASALPLVNNLDLLLQSESGGYILGNTPASARSDVSTADTTNNVEQVQVRGRPGLYKLSVHGVRVPVANPTYKGQRYALAVSGDFKTVPTEECAGISTSCPRSCSNRGVCDSTSNSCKCEVGWTGVDCSASTCINLCMNRGSCVKGECVCDSGYEGVYCQHAVYALSAEYVYSTVVASTPSWFKFEVPAASPNFHYLTVKFDHLLQVPFALSVHKGIDMVPIRSTYTRKSRVTPLSNSLQILVQDIEPGTYYFSVFLNDRYTCNFTSVGVTYYTDDRLRCLNDCNGMGKCSVDPETSLVMCKCPRGYDGSDCGVEPRCEPRSNVPLTFCAGVTNYNIVGTRYDSYSWTDDRNGGKFADLVQQAQLSPECIDRLKPIFCRLVWNRCDAFKMGVGRISSVCKSQCQEFVKDCPLGGGFNCDLDIFDDEPCIPLPCSPDFGQPTVTSVTNYTTLNHTTDAFSLTVSGMYLGRYDQLDGFIASTEKLYPTWQSQDLPLRNGVESIILTVYGTWQLPKEIPLNVTLNSTFAGQLSGNWFTTTLHVNSPQTGSVVVRSDSSGTTSAGRDMNWWTPLTVSLASLAVASVAAVLVTRFRRRTAESNLAQYLALPVSGA